MSYSESHAVLGAALPIATQVGSPAAIEGEVLALFDAFERPLLRYAASFGLSAGDAEDVVQDAFFELFRHLRRGRPRQNLPGWLFQVVHNLALKRRRRIRRQVLWAQASRDVDDRDNRVDPHHNPEALMLDAERRRRWRSVLRAMPDRDRRCLLLRAEGLRYREIAHALGVSLGSVAKSLARGVARLASAAQV